MTGGALKRAVSPSQPISPPPLRRKVETTVKKTVSTSFFTPASKKKGGPVTWRIVDNSLIVGKYTVSDRDQKRSTGKPKVAAFDFDSTLVETASGNRFPKNSSDWRWWNECVPSRLRELDAGGYHVVIISNQKAVSLKKEKTGGDSKSLTNLKGRVSAVMEQLGIPLSVYAATENDEYRKPRAGMWRELLDDYDFDVTGVDTTESIFVGDAAGRPKDHSSVDRGFAANAGIPFKTPEEFFLNAPPEPVVESFDPSVYVRSDSDSTDVSPPFSRESPLELVIFCGSPGAGKSTFYWNYLEPLDYERVNQDILKTRPKCIKVAKEHLAAGRSVVVDNTNADPETRAHWVEVAKEFKIPIRCVYFSASPALCKHNNAVRAANKSLNPESRTLLPGIAFGDFLKRFKEPTLSEGFKDIIRVDFQFLGDDEAKRIWKQHWI